MKSKHKLAVLSLPLLVVSLACVCTSALPFGGAPDVNATVEASTGADIEGLQATAEALGGELNVEELQPTAEAGIATVEAITEGLTSPENVDILAPFPVPPNIESIVLNDPESTLLMVAMSSEDLMDFYMVELTNMGLAERPLLTVTSDGTFSMVYDGWEDGRSVVVQGTPFGEDIMSISIRLEQVD